MPLRGWSGQSSNKLEAGYNQAVPRVERYKSPQVSWPATPLNYFSQSFRLPISQYCALQIIPNKQVYKMRNNMALGWFYSPSQILHYFATRVTSLKPPRAQLKNPYAILRQLDGHQWNMFFVGFAAWAWDGTLTCHRLHITFDFSGTSNATSLLAAANATTSPRVFIHSVGLTFDLAFDFFTISLTATEIAADFGKEPSAVTWVSGLR